MNWRRRLMSPKVHVNLWGAMSELGQKRQFGDILITSVFPLKADIRRVA